MNKLVFRAFFALFLFIMADTAYSLSVQTHKKINENIAQKTFNGFSLDTYLKNQLNFKSGSEEKLNSLMTWEWLSDGGQYEDLPTRYEPYLRSVNHFHNPLRSLDKAGFTGIWGTGALSGKSAILWSQQAPGTQSPGGYYSWFDVRSYFYYALTSSEQSTRNTNYPDTFRGLGQLMHLVQDMSVPEHTRDDGHYADAYEEWIRDSPSSGDAQRQALLSTAVANAKFFDMTALEQPSVFGSDAPVSIANLFDTDRYDNTNPEVTTDQNIGLAEYTNANFISPDTISSSGTFSYPIVSDSPTSSVTRTTRDIPDPLNAGSTIKREYYWKERHGETGYLLAGVGFLRFYADTNNIGWTPDKLITPLDENVYMGYATLLLPRAIGYSASLLNYFFRGSIDMTADPNGSGQYIITNYSNEALSGAFSIYYDDESDNRISIQTWNLAISAGGQSTLVSFTRPTNPAPKDPNSYVLVFYGQMGSEEGAVIGKVLSNLPVPTLPAPTPVSPLTVEYVYGPDHDEGLVWSAVSGGNGKYEVSIDNKTSIVVTGTKYSSISGLTQAYHTWKVATQNSAGVAGPWSATNTFLKYNYLSAPTTISPVTTQQYDYPTLDWSPVSGANNLYHVYIYNTAVGDFKAATSNDYLYSRSWQSSIALEDGLVYWAVEAIDSRGVHGQRSTRGYWTQKATLAVPSLIQPQNGSTTTEANPVLQWSAVSDADSYDVYIDSTTDNTTSTSYTAGVDAGNHTWKVRARNTDGVVSNWSAPWSFISELKPCNSSMLSGGDGVTSTSYELGKKSGGFYLTWDTYYVMDQIDVIYDGIIIYSTGWFRGVGSQYISYSGTVSSVTIRVTGGTDTGWEYTIGCP